MSTVLLVNFVVTNRLIMDALIVRKWCYNVQTWNVCCSKKYIILYKRERYIYIFEKQKSTYNFNIIISKHKVDDRADKWLRHFIYQSWLSYILSLDRNMERVCCCQFGQLGRKIKHACCHAATRSEVSAHYIRLIKSN